MRNKILIKNLLFVLFVCFSLWPAGPDGDMDTGGEACVRPRALSVGPGLSVLTELADDEVGGLCTRVRALSVDTSNLGPGFQPPHKPRAGARPRALSGDMWSSKRGRNFCFESPDSKGFGGDRETPLVRCRGRAYRRKPGLIFQKPEECPGQGVSPAVAVFMFGNAGFCVGSCDDESGGDNPKPEKRMKK